MAHTLRSILFAVFLFSSQSLFSQVSIGYYGGNIEKFSIGYNFTERIWTSVKIASNHGYERYFQDYLSVFVPELSVGLDLIRKDHFEGYLAVMGFMDLDVYYYGFGFSLGGKVFPFEKAPNLGFVIETTPFFDDYLEIYWQNNWGLVYTFGD